MRIVNGNNTRGQRVKFVQFSCSSSVAVNGHVVL